ncbi:transcriptional regulator, LysR family [Cupriavidus sp. YR651]|uniref:LysR family transcriptional regulator n=1 Tax=Cupriavidus sp. YR651 TaxID=1855315 RepID=UPI0008912FA3|nr:LysR family transcriptional regulator [Cupriavidus sp. YR651]SDD87508.1 transcriptional regulator, LysR family [Cupriavidus sp. YR651]
MDRFLSFEAFVRVADTLSFAEAARQLGVTNSVISHRVQQLEKHINAPLFHRSTRHVRLSEVGETYYRRCAEMVADLSDLTDQMRDLRASPVGRLRIQVLPGFAIRHFAAILTAFTKKYPDIELDVVVNDRVGNPIEDGVDVSFQIFPAPNDSLIERRLFTVRRMFCAAPEYLEKHGAPVQPCDLTMLPVALYSAYPTRNKWKFLKDGNTTEVELSAKMRTNSVHLLRDYALTGAAIVCLPSLVAGDELMAGTLAPVLQDYALPPLSFSAVYPATQRQALKVRVLVDFLASCFQGDPPWDVPLIERGWLPGN